MDLQIADKTALVTASSSGIGLAAATALAAEGAIVVLNGRDGDRLKQAEEQLRTHVPTASVRLVVADVGTGDGVRAVAAAVPAVDILVNSVGAYPSVISNTSKPAWTQAVLITRQ